ncbi:MerR family transcriptional regulator [Candidatus Nitronereus thalassa]|uniref:MerR family transcriptional regulator n=1 Tax=Candidatus Nitronereus thalassa TaxID=3020898 RepID=A0ABU3K7V2_9BACT|nr:MerR family transcriptional regulator [Candidatus Nitronereus thalassa]MDT7042520.1 MerR family transcriptional regulator [Candidatus Nitronereus thalassa]
MSKFQCNPSGFGIKHLSEITGLSAHVIRKWDQRYNFLSPYRAENGYRLFTPIDLQLLIFIKSQVALGNTIGQLALRGREALIAEMNSGPLDLSVFPVEVQSQVAEILDAARKGNQAAVEYTLYLFVQHYGIDRALIDIFFPILRTIGDLWHQGRIGIPGEQSVSQTIRRVLAEDILLQKGAEKPQALIACMPNDYHEIGAMAALRLLQKCGWKALYLGADSSIEIVRLACTRRQAQLVLFSCVVERSPEEMKALIDNIVKHLLPITNVVIGGQGGLLYIDWLERKGIRYIGKLEAVKELHPRSLEHSRIA